MKKFAADKDAIVRHRYGLPGGNPKKKIFSEIIFKDLPAFIEALSYCLPNAVRFRKLFAKSVRIVAGLLRDSLVEYQQPQPGALSVRSVIKRLRPSTSSSLDMRHLLGLCTMLERRNLIEWENGEAHFVNCDALDTAMPLLKSLVL
jgi:hypothetical protein